MLTDGDGGTSAASTKTIVVIATNDPVTPADDAYAVAEGQTLVSDPLGAHLVGHRLDACRQLIFDNVLRSENLVDFPVLVQLDSSRVDYSLTQNDGADLRFVDLNGTLLPHEIETWNAAGTSYVWVKVPQIDGSSGTDHIWLYYGNAVAAAWRQNVAAVWNSGYAAVYHLDAHARQDSTANLNHGTNSGSLDATGDAWLTGSGLTAWTTMWTWDRPRLSTTCLRVGERFRRGSGPRAGVRVAMVGFSTRPSTTSPTAGGGSNSMARTNRCGSSKAIRVPRGAWYTPSGSTQLGAWQHVVLVYNNSSVANDPVIYVNGRLQTVAEEAAPSGVADSDAATGLRLGNFRSIRRAPSWETWTKCAWHASCVPPTGLLPNMPP